MSNLTRPIIGIENRTAQEVFDIMCDRFTHSSAPLKPSGDAGEVVERLAVAAGIFDRKPSEVYAANRLSREAASLITTLVAENERQGEQIQRMEYSDGDAEHWRSLAGRLERQLATARDLVEQAFKDGLAYGNNVADADPDVAWQQSRIRALTPGVSDAE